MNVLILGSGAREHAIGWKLQKQRECSKLFIHPGNSGTLDAGFDCFPGCLQVSELVEKAHQAKIDLVVVGPEGLLAEGYSDAFRKESFLVVGPDQWAAQLETSKIFAKRFMVEAEIPTAEYQIFESPHELLSFSNNEWPWVLKLDGLAGGKGVLIAQSKEDVRKFSNAIWTDEVFGPGPHRVLAEKFISGREVSYMGFCDGNCFVPLETATDYKRLQDDDWGPNTGGMGAVSPSPFLTAPLESHIQNAVIQPFLRHMQRTRLDFRGVLFVGLMIDPKGNPWVLEFNTRLGDPETQCVLPRLKSSLLNLLISTAQKNLKDQAKAEWDPKHCVYVVASSPGYPEAPRVGNPIEGLDLLSNQVQLFFGGVVKENGTYFTHSGRVLGLGALGETALLARKKVYEELSHIQWPGIHYRKDIGL